MNHRTASDSRRRRRSRLSWRRAHDRLDGDGHDDERGELLDSTGSERAARPGDADSWRRLDLDGTLLGATDTVCTARAHVGDELVGRLDEALGDQAMTKRLRMAAIAHDVTIVLNHVLQRTHHVVSGAASLCTACDENWFDRIELRSATHTEW